ncbi:zinc finger protein 112-like [Homarus americanus]|uniref:zinc finger protein 112-like n=1 Tax=Homarus americanus TaxID=6706 RepID=UPI001C478A7D|nr:zinc finger protein 112-like [Homarus americanus]
MKKSGDSTCFKNTTEKSVVEDKTNTTLYQENYSSCLRSNTSIKLFICNTCRKSFQSTDELNFHCTTECAHSLTCGTHNCSQCSHPSHQSSSTSVIETNMRNSSSKHVTKFTNNICHSPGISLYKQPLKVQDFTITQKINTFPNPPDIVVTHLHVHQNSLQAKVLGRASVEKLFLCEEGKGEDPEEPFRYVAYNVQNPEQPVRFVVDNREDPGQVFNFGSDNGEDPAQPFGFGSDIGEDPVQPFGFGSDIEEDPVQPFGSGSDNGEDQQELFSFGLDSGQPFRSRADYIRIISSEKMVEKFLDPSKKIHCDSSKTEEKISFAPQKVLKRLSEENDFLGFEDGVQDYEVNENFFPSIILNKKSCIGSANEEKKYLCLQNIEEDNCENTTTIDPEYKCMESLVEGPSCNKSNIPLLIPSAELVPSVDNSTLPVSSDLEACGDLQTLNDVSFAPPRKSKGIVRRRAKRLLDQNTSKLLLTSGVKKRVSHTQQPSENFPIGQVQENTSLYKKYPDKAVTRQSVQVNQSRKLDSAFANGCQPRASNTAKQYKEDIVIIKSGKRLYSCNICHNLCSSPGDLVRHMKIHTKESPFKCHLCPRTYTHRSSLTKHLDVHEGKKPFICLVCKAAFSQKVHLKTHFSIHTGEKPFRCSECGKAFSRRDHLKGHKYTHTSERPYKCDMCPRDFKCNSNLFNHRRIHLEDRRYQCDFCSASFIVAHSLMLHMRTHTGEKPVHCPICNVDFRFESSLRKHATSKHPGFEVRGSVLVRAVQ